MNENAIQANKATYKMSTMAWRRVGPFTVTTRYIWYAARAVREIVPPRTKALRNHIKRGAVGRWAFGRRRTPKRLLDHLNRRFGWQRSICRTAAVAWLNRSLMVALRRPSIEPDLRQSFVIAHELRTQFDERLLFRQPIESSDANPRSRYSAARRRDRSGPYLRILAHARFRAVLLP